MANSEAKKAANRKYAATKRKLIHTNLQIPIELRNRLKQCAEIDKLTISQLISKLLDEYYS